MTEATTSDSIQRRLARVHFAAILGAAFVLRLVVVLPHLRHDPYQWFFSQATELGRLGASIAAGHGLDSPFGGATGPSAFLAPGYPIVVAAAFRCFGPYTQGAAVALLLLQVGFAVLTVFAIMLVARKVFDAHTANIAGAISALSPPLVFLPTLFWESCLSSFLLAGFVALAVHWTPRPTLWKWAAFGAWCALAMLVNPSLTFALFSILIWAAWRVRRVSPFAPLLAVVACAVIFAPWPLRNARALHAFIPMRSNLGYELWQGNRPGSAGGFSPALHPNVNREEFARYAALGEIAYMHEKSVLATEAIRADPPRFIRLTALRIVKFWLGLGSRAWSLLIVVYVAFTTALGAAGLVLLLRRSRGLGLLFLAPLMLFPLPYYITHPDFRFRLVLDPLAAILSAYAIVTWRKRTQSVHPHKG